MRLAAEELLAGSNLTFTIAVPPELLQPDGAAPSQGVDAVQEPRTVVLRPLTVGDIQVIIKAAREDDLLTSSLMLQRALVEPKLTATQVMGLPAGLVRFLVNEVNRLSGLATRGETLAELVQAPLSRACFILAKEFGWTPQAVSEMTIGQILLYLEMLNGASQQAEVQP